MILTEALQDNSLPEYVEWNGKLRFYLIYGGLIGLYLKRQG